MKKLTFVTMICVFCLASCNSEKKNQLISGIDKSNLDTTASPVVDFYQYACGGWIKKHPLTAEYGRYSTFDQLGEENREQLKELISELANQKNPNGSVAQKIGDLYTMGMDTISIEKEAAAPIQGELQTIVNMKEKNDLTAQMFNMALTGKYPFFAIFGEADPQDSKMTIGWFYQTGLGIGDRDYYLEKEMQQYRDGYVDYLTKMFTISKYAEKAGFAGKEKEMAEKVLDMEIKLANIFMSRNELRDPNATNNIITVEEFQAMLPAIDVKAYLQGLGLERLQTVNAATLEYFKKLNPIIETTDMEVVKAYLASKTINSAAPYLSQDFVETNFDFYGRLLSGKESLQPRWKRVTSVVNGALGEAVGEMYVQKHFPAESKERMIKLVKNLEIAMGERIQNNTWMTDETKAKAMDKLASFHVKIGYPDTWRSYADLNIEKDGYYANVERAEVFNNKYELSKIGKPVNLDEWLITPQTVNAYYNPSTNEICFPAGILQPPFFNSKADDAVNYGAIGMVIGHEMTHGFDDQGGKYDKEGNLKDWWSAEDTRSFDERKQVLIDYFNAIEVLNVDGKPLLADGNFTLGENIADNGGVKIAYVAMQKAKENGEIEDIMDGFTAEQRFFIAYAQVWAGNIRDAEIIRRTKEDPHSLGKWRVNGTLPHVDAFLEAFGVKESDPMYIAPEQRAEIW